MVVLAICAPARAGSQFPYDDILDADTECSGDLPPAAYSIAGVSDDGHKVVVEVLVFLDGVEKGRAKRLFERAQTAYAALAIHLRPVAFKRIDLVPDEPATKNQRAKIDAGRLLQEVKKELGGARPKGTDIVHTLTMKDLTLPTYGSSPVGVAECVGGIQHPDLAFSATEDGPDEYSLDAFGITHFSDAPAKAVAHEIGHLLGAHHQYQSCVEGIEPGDVTSGGPAPCTIMSDTVELSSLRFGTLEATVVRGYAVAFADS